MSAPAYTRGERRLRRHPLQVQWTVIHSLFIRHLSAEFGQLRGGVLWAFLEPLVQVIIFSGVYLLKGKAMLNNIPIPMLVITGAAPFILFRQTVNRSPKAFRQARALFNYRVVQPVDPVLALVMHYAVFFIFTLTGFVTACHFLKFHFEQVLFLELTVILALLVTLTTGFALTFTVFNEFYPEARRMVPFVMKPLFFLSGIFFTAESLPEEIRPWLLLNPLFHITEVTRSCFYHSFPSHGSLTYITAWAGCSLLIGLSLMKANHWRLIQK